MSPAKSMSFVIPAVALLVLLAIPTMADDRHDCVHGSLDLRIAACTKILDNNPPNFVTLGNRGISYRMTGKYDSALVDLNKAISLNPNIAGLYLERGLAQDGGGDHERAIADFSEAIRRDSSLVQAYFGRAIAYEAEGRLDPSTADLNRATELDRNLVAALYMQRGYALGAARQYDSAIAAFDRAIALGPGWLEAYFGRGGSYEEKGDLDRALADYRKCLELKATTELDRQRQQTAREQLEKLGQR